MIEQLPWQRTGANPERVLIFGTQMNIAQQSRNLKGFNHKGTKDAKKNLQKRSVFTG